jgi:3,4-dihydroxy 2-butanone 4-phosphate synthase/GTP cyclohydrolase II
MKFDSLERALELLEKGNPIIVFDEYREKEGDIFYLGQFITPEKINFLLTNAKGMICVACGEEIIKKFQIPLMVEDSGDVFQTNFCVSISAAEEVTTGISASDRTKTISCLCSEKSTSKDIVMPGHTLPLLARENSDRFGHTEGAVKLARKVKKIPVVVASEVLNTKGEIANKEELFDLSQKFDIPIITLEMIKNF